MSTNTETSRSKKRKKRKAESESEDDNRQMPLDEVPDEDAGENFRPKKKKKKKDEKSKADPLNWPRDDILTLFERINDVVPRKDVMKYTRRLEKLDWQKVKFGDYSAKECSSVFSIMIKRVRQNQTIPDLVDNMKSMYDRQPMLLQGSMFVQHGPKKPLSTYFLFIQDKKRKLQRKNPGLKTTELSRLLAEKYKNLSARKKQKYSDRYHANMEAYKEEVAKLKEEHPDWNVSIGGKAPKCPTPLALFIEARIPKLTEENGELTHRQAYDLAVQKWKRLKDKKKLKWIKKAVSLFEDDYQVQSAAYQRVHPDFVPKITCLNKQEQHIKNLSEGMPEKPPPNGFALFKKLKFAEAKQSGESFAAINSHVLREWHALGEDGKQDYNNQIKKAKKEYNVAYRKYLLSLPEEKRLQLVQTTAKDDSTRMSPSSKTESVVSGEVEDEEGVEDTHDENGEPGHPERARSALSFYIEEQCQEMLGSDSDTDETDVTLALTKKFKELSEEQKEKYRKMADKQHKQTEMSKSITVPSPGKNSKSVSTPKAKNGPKKTFPGEPQKPPGHGYSLFSSKMLGKLTYVPSKQRMAFIGQKWKELSEDERASYNAKAKKKVKKYAEELEAFKQTLSPSELLEYEQVLASRGGKKKLKVKMFG